METHGPRQDGSLRARGLQDRYRLPSRDGDIPGWGIFYITFAGGVGMGKGPGCGMGRACFGLNSLRAHRLGRVEMNAGEHLDTSGRWRFD